MQNITSYNVVPAVPEKLSKLKDLSFNLYWSWVEEIIQLFRRLDEKLWDATGHNPVKMLGDISQRRLETLSNNNSFLAHLERSYDRLQQYLNDETWFQKNYPEHKDDRIAYFSAEFGITECLPIYSGGLGILAGDHLKAASDLGLPLVGVGLLYQQGYFRQYLNQDGWQQELYPTNDFYNLPIKPVKNSKDEHLTIHVDFPGRKVYAQIWVAQVGRIPLYLLDTNIPLNDKKDQDITDQLYGGDKEIRIQQEMILGIGGVRALSAMNIKPKVCHMNEGHSAFLGLERIKDLMNEHKLVTDEAFVAMSPSNVFTTHTPVEAGIDQFPPDLIEKYFSAYYKPLNKTQRDFFSLGRQNPDDANEPFNMAYLALTLSAYYNGVSRLHGDVSKKMWQKRWPQLPEKEIPIAYVTNGIHTSSWLSHDMKALFYRYLGPAYREDPSDQTVWENVETIPPEELWNTHERRRERLIAFARKRLKDQLIKRGASVQEINMSDEILNPNTLTIGFARRFATYKRGNLILRDIERLKRLLTDKERPIQIIIAGKAHPRDDAGKEIIKQLIHFSRDPEIRRRFVYIEDYDMVVARYMVQGVDVWLNNPRRPMEASGTSGMKAAANGVLNLSILDGWWIEGYEIDPNVGWAIGKGEDYEDYNYQDDVEVKALYNLLENDIIPLFYDRGQDNLPRGWITRMKATLRRLAPVFNTNRMVQEYTEKCYINACNRYQRLSQNNFSGAKNLATYKKQILENWKNIKIEKVQTDSSTEFPIGHKLKVEAWVKLGSLKPEYVDVQIYFGNLDENRTIMNGNSVKMEVEGKKDGVYHYAGNIECLNSGLHGLTLRILPYHADLVNPYEMHLIQWQ